MTLRRRVGIWLLVVGLVLALAGIGYRVWRVWRAARPLLKRIDTVQALIADPTTVNPTTLRPMLQGTHAELVALRDEVHPFVAQTSRMGWVPGIGPDLQALSPLLDIAVDLSGAGEAAMEGLAPLLDLIEADAATGGEDPLSLATHTLADARPQLEAAQALVEHAARRRNEIDAAGLSPRLARLVERLDQALPLAQAGVEAALVAPEILGISGPRTYLLLAQNDDELRPTGGFISGTACVTVDDGEIVEFFFRDPYLVDDFSKPYDEPPAPLYEYMLSELWLFRDANWSPDFPTSARKVAELYTYGQGIELDGVIAFDQQGVARLIEGLGPLMVEGWDEPVTGENFIAIVRQAWNPPQGEVTGEWMNVRKDFMNRVAEAILGQIMQRPETVNWLELGQALWQMLQERHLLIYLEEPAAASWLHAQGWDGALRPAQGDYLMVVEANLGFNKVNPTIERTLDYHVTLRPDGRATAVLAVHYRHTGLKSDDGCVQRGVYIEGEQMSYEGLMEGCYWNYLRVYAPDGSHLNTASRHPTPGSYLLRGADTTGEAEMLASEAGKAVFGQFFVVERGQTLEARFSYNLPQVARPGDPHSSPSPSRERENHWLYTLLVQKQPGTDNTPMTLTIVLPSGARPLTATPPSHTIDGRTIQFVLELDTDVTVEVGYELTNDK